MFQNSCSEFTTCVWLNTGRTWAPTTKIYSANTLYLHRNTMKAWNWVDTVKITCPQTTHDLRTSPLNLQMSIIRWKWLEINHSNRAALNALKSIYQSFVRTFWKPLDKWGLMTSDCSYNRPTVLLRTSSSTHSPSHSQTLQPFLLFL